MAAAGLAVAAVLAGSAAAQSSDEQLAQRYSPVVRLVAQQDQCGHGEPFEPIDVDAVLGNPEVALHGPWSQTEVVKIGPTAKDLSAGLFDYHLDFPGDALQPGCDYEKWQRYLLPGTTSRTYARVITEPRHPGQLALQYWFFYVYNDWNDKHEGDWEMVQLDFRASTSAEALDRRPYEIGFSQHEGAERADWSAEKLQRVGSTHPVVYPAMGSHANYYSSALFLGRSAAQGVGCDNTVGPSRDVRPQVTLVPGSGYLDRFPWLAYAGGWGEEHPQFYGGPTGPNTKPQWTEPITWANEEWRDTAFAVPGGKSVGTSATDFFCGAVGAGSSVLTKLVANPWRVLIALGLLLLLVVWLCSRTRWDESEPFHVRRRRPWGSLVTASLHLYADRPWLFLGIGVLFVPLGVVIALLQYLVFQVGGLAPLADSVGESNAFVAGLAFALGLLFTIFGLNFVQAATSVAVEELDRGGRITAWAAYRQALGRLPNLLLALLGAALVITILTLTGAGALLGFFLLVRWLFLPQAVMLQSAQRPLRASAQLVRGHWWRVASVFLLVITPALALGPLIGSVMLLLTPASFNVVNIVSGIVYMVTLPFAATVTTYLYYDLLVRDALEHTERAEGGILPAEV